MEKIKDNFIELLIWKNGKPFCPCCKLPIEPCHKCGSKTAMMDVDRPCSHCKEEDAVCHVCRDCFRKTGGDK